MSTPITCYFMRALGVDRLSLRRFSSSDYRICPVTGYHNASVFLKDEPNDSTKSIGYEGDPPRQDTRWPTKCACGYEFLPTDHWQIFRERLYARNDNSEEICTLSAAQPGAMWDAHWMPVSRRGPDGLCLMLRLPGKHDWMVDGPSRNGSFWTRTGSVPKITASPSILVPGEPGQPCLYHGWLRDGVLHAV